MGLLTMTFSMRRATSLSPSSGSKKCVIATKEPDGSASTYSATISAGVGVPS